MLPEHAGHEILEPSQLVLSVLHWSGQVVPAILQSGLHSVVDTILYSDQAVQFLLLLDRISMFIAKTPDMSNK